MLIIWNPPAVSLRTGLPSGSALASVAILILVLDCVDGTIARATCTTSQTGHYLDFLTDVIFRVSFYSTIGLLADLSHSSPGWLWGRAAWLGAFAALLAVLARLCRVYVEHLTGFGPYELNDTSERPASLSEIVFSAISGIDFLLPFFLLGAGLLNILSWVILWLAVYSTLDLAYTQITALQKIR